LESLRNFSLVAGEYASGSASGPAFQVFQVSQFLYAPRNSVSSRPGNFPAASHTSVWICLQNARLQEPPTISQLVSKDRDFH